jgi:hypothetical protein
VNRALGLTGLLLLVGGCQCGGSALTTTGGPDSGNTDSGNTPNPDGGGGGDAGLLTACQPSSTDLTGCACATPGTQRSCYPLSAPPQTRGIGLCHDGSQTCQSTGEFGGTYGPCTGAVVPAPENCTDGLDHNCNGKVGCADPACAADPSCNTGCDAGQTRKCYDGPAGTENVGVCRDGVQTCSASGTWGTTCVGEVLPAPKEDCCAAKDMNCNGLPGCFDILPPSFCPIVASCCQPPQCSADAGLPNGCSCPTGSGDTQTCPSGTHVVQGPKFAECCPCSTSDCANDVNCCGTAACANAANCQGLTCTTLPASCNGQVNTDCDDFPEDCDEPCCLCSQCTPCGNTGANCQQASDCCTPLTCSGGTCQ